MPVSYSSLYVCGPKLEKNNTVYIVLTSICGRKEKKQQSSVIEKSTISPMSLLNLHKFSSIDLRCASQVHMPLPGLHEICETRHSQNVIYLISFIIIAEIAC